MVGGFTKRAAIICGGGSSYDDNSDLCLEFDAEANRCDQTRARSHDRELQRQRCSKLKLDHFLN
jgi:hypothetical protein